MRTVNPGGRKVCNIGLRPLACWDGGVLIPVSCECNICDGPISHPEGTYGICVCVCVCLCVAECDQVQH